MNDSNCKLCGAPFEDGEVFCIECGSHRTLPSYRYTAERGRPVLERIISSRSVKVATLLAVLPLCAVLLSRWMPVATDKIQKSQPSEQVDRSHPYVFDNLRSELGEPDAYAGTVKATAARPPRAIRRHKAAVVAEAGDSRFKD